MGSEKKDALNKTYSLQRRPTKWQQSVRGSAAMVAGCVLALSIVGTVMASDPDALITRLQRHYRTTDSFTAHFVETLTSPGSPPRQRSGKVAYRKPGMIRWEFDPPQSETIVADGTTLYDYDPGLNQVVEMSERKAFKNRGVAAFILGVGDLERDFNGQTVPVATNDGLIHLLLTPKGGGPKIELGLDNKNLNIKSLQTIDALNNKTDLQFSMIERNVALDTSLFAFAVPPGVDIVNAAATR